MINIFIRKLHRGNTGAVTILLIIVMVPLLLLSSFLVDVVRVKSYSQDALMAADNYAEGYLAEYNNLLKQLYGLYAISDTMSGKGEISKYEDVVKKSFSSEGGSFTPYNNLNVSLETRMLSDSTLNHREIIRSQIGDFMRFRIAQMLLMDGEEIEQKKDDAKNGQTIADKAEILEAKTEFDEKNAEVVASLLKFYDQLEKFHQLQDMDDDMKNALLDGAGAFRNAAETAKGWEKMLESELGADWSLAHMFDDPMPPYPGISKEEKIKYRKEQAYLLEDAIGGIQEAQGKYNENAKELNTILDNMEKEVQEVIKKLDALDTARDKLFKKLDSYTGTDKQVIESIRIDVNRTLEDYGVSGSSSGEAYKQLVERIKKDKEVPDKINEYVNDALMRMNDDKTKFLNADIDDVLGRDAFESIKDIEWEKIEYTISTSTIYREKDKNIYEKLKKLHDSYANSSAEEAAKKIKEASDAQKDQMKKMEELLKKESVDKKARDIPSSLGSSYGDDKSVWIDPGIINMAKGLFGNAASIFRTYDDGLTGWSEQMISRLLVPYYDFGMFTCRTTGKKAGDDKQTVSLTGLVQDGSNHWMYGAEIEYILCNHKKAEANLNEIRNRIILARLVLNYWSTYQISTVNGIIKAAAVAAAIFTFGAAYNAVDQGLRIAVTIAETIADWDILTDGDKICFFKSAVKEMSAVSEISKILGKSIGASDKDKKGAKWFSYIKVCKVFMLIFVDPEDIVDRTANLITVNTNYIMMGEDAFKGVSGKGGLQFRLDQAYTAVEVTAKVNSKTAVMDVGWQRWVSPQTSTNINNIFGKEYRYTVIRGY